MASCRPDRLVLAWTERLRDGAIMKVYLVDGTYELFRAFYGAPSSINAKGREVGASRALSASLLKLVRDAPATHVACAFDHVIESFRNELFAGYKTGEGIDPALFGQFELAERVTSALGFVTWPMIEFEADDAIATAAAKLDQDPRVDEVLLCSPDKDLAQSVTGNRILLWDRMRDRRLNEAGVAEKFGVPPRAIPDYLALVGDAADGIPGIRGWGEKSASTILSAYGSLDGIPTRDSDWSVKLRGSSKLAEALNRERDAARLYRTLATLRVDVPIDVTPEALEWRGPDDAIIDGIAEELGDPALADRARTIFRASCAKSRASS